MADKIITQEYLHELFDYKDGELFWKKKPNRYANIKIGQKAGRYREGYFDTSINAKRYQNHKIIFMMFYGFMPKILDHIDCNPSNNKIENLREATQQQNCLNRKLSKSNKSGYKNIYWHEKTKKWAIGLKTSEKRYYGEYSFIEEAIKIAKKLREKHHQNFANHADQR